jgi:hypothetical protein
MMMVPSAAARQVATNTVLGHAGVAEDGGVDENDISHRQEGGDAGDDFGTNRGAVFGELEILIK